MLRMNFGASYSRDLALYTQMNSWARSRNKAVSEQEKISSSCKLLANLVLAVHCNLTVMQFNIVLRFSALLC